MRIGNRQLPYPVFNRSESLNCFQKGRFIFEHEPCERKEDSDEFIIPGARISFNSVFLRRLLAEQKIGIMMIVECSETLYRRNWELTEEPRNIAFPFSDIRGKVEISAFAYAKQAISGYCDADFLEEFSGICFDIEKNDIIAIDDGFSLTVNHVEKSDDYVASIITVSKNVVNNQLMLVQLKTNKIDIVLPPQQYELYAQMKSIAALRNILFSTLLVPSIASAFSQLSAESKGKGYEDFRDFQDDYEWSSSFADAYLKAFKKELTIDELQTANALEVAQVILKNPTTKGIEEIYTIAYNGVGEDNDRG